MLQEDAVPVALIPSRLACFPYITANPEALESMTSVSHKASKHWEGRGNGPLDPQKKNTTTPTLCLLVFRDVFGLTG